MVDAIREEAFPMCFDHDSVPPIRRLSGASVEASEVTLTALDGTRFTAYSAAGPDPEGAGIVILPDVRGLYPFYEELAVRFAERGVDAVAIDYFGRTAGVGRRDDGFDFTPHVERLTADGVRADCAAAVAFLRHQRASRPVFTVGFCIGGSNSWQQAANGLGLSGAIGFYGHPGRVRPEGAPPVVDRVGDMSCPILGLMGGDDPGIPLEEVERFRAALDAAGVLNEIVVYDGAPHSFFDRKQEEFLEASADAWERVLSFIDRHA
jgi:carboxymethylenebutenolidase